MSPILEHLISRYPALQDCADSISVTFDTIAASYRQGGKLLVCGNGGSAADAEHIVGELMKGFCKKRHVPDGLVDNMVSLDCQIGTMLGKHLQGALPAIALSGHNSLTTAWINDCEPLLHFAQQVNGLGNKEDVLLCISTSGNSKNVVAAAITAKAKGLKVVGLTGARKSKISELADITIMVPETETYKIQELHLPVYHCLCLMLENEFFDE